MTAAISALADLIGAQNVLTGDAISEDYSHDEALAPPHQMPLAVARPRNADDVVKIVKWATTHKVPLTPRGSGTGLSGACIPLANGVVVSFEHMKRVIEIDTQNHTAIVEPGVTLEQINAAANEKGLVYPVFPGELSASLGGNVATNAGGMRAVKYGVTRHHVLGLQAVLATGEVIRTGGKIVKNSTGYDLTQLIIGSEGTLAVVTEVTLKLVPLLKHNATLLAPFESLTEAVGSIPALLESGAAPLLCEYIDQFTMMAITMQSGVSLGVSDDIQQKTQAYLLVVIEGRTQERVNEDVELAGELLAERGAMDIFVLPGNSGQQLVEAREKSFWAAKRAGASDVIDIVVPRASLPQYMQRVREIAMSHSTMIPGCGHAGDGNVHLAVFEQDPEKRHALMHELFEAGRSLGGVISGEHGIGVEKKQHFMELEDPIKLELLRRIKAAFDPSNILNPGTIFD